MNGEDSLGLTYEKELKGTGITEHKHYLQAGGITFAMHTMRVKTAGGTIANPQLPKGVAPYTSSYLHHDQLGSVVAITNNAGTVVERLAYDPWGKRRFVNGSADTLDAITGQYIDRGFTMHEHIDEMGIINMNGRIYDPLIGRFMSADPTIPHPYILQSFNRYSYVRNNPLRLTDPTGYDDGDGSDGTGWDGYSNDRVTTTTTSSGQTVVTVETNVNGTLPGGSTIITTVIGAGLPGVPANTPVGAGSADTQNPYPPAVAPAVDPTPQPKPDLGIKVAALPAVVYYGVVYGVPLAIGVMTDAGPKLVEGIQILHNRLTVNQANSAGEGQSDGAKEESDKGVKDAIAGAKPELDSSGKPRKGGYEKPGGDAKDDLNKLPGTVGENGQKILPDGSVAGIHGSSTRGGMDTLHINRPSGSQDIKIRYP